MTFARLHKNIIFWQYSLKFLARVTQKNQKVTKTFPKSLCEQQLG